MVYKYCALTCSVLLTIQSSYGGQRKRFLFLKVIAHLLPGGAEVGFQNLLDVVRHRYLQILQLAGRKNERQRERKRKRVEEG